MPERNGPPQGYEPLRNHNNPPNPFENEDPLQYASSFSNTKAQIPLP